MDLGSFLLILKNFGIGFPWTIHSELGTGTKKEPLLLGLRSTWTRLRFNLLGQVWNHLLFLIWAFPGLLPWVGTPVLGLVGLSQGVTLRRFAVPKAWAWGPLSLFHWPLVLRAWPLTFFLLVGPRTLLGRIFLPKSRG